MASHTQQSFDQQCLNENMQCLIDYSWEQDSLHILSRYTAAGDQIRRDYVNHVMNSAISLSEYCDIVTAVIQQVSHS